MHLGHEQHHEHSRDEEWRLSSASMLIDALATLGFNLNRIIDIGCGYGWLLRAARNRGVLKTGFGIDGPWVDLRHYKDQPEFFVTRDLTAQPITGLDHPSLITCLETAEHLPAYRAASFVGELTSYRVPILFSAAIPGQGGQGHVNEQWQSYWADLFSRSGFVISDCMHPAIWAEPKLPFWLRQNIFLAAPSAQLPPRLEWSIVEKFDLLNRVSPELYKRGVAPAHSCF